MVTSPAGGGQRRGQVVARTRRDARRGRGSPSSASSSRSVGTPSTWASGRSAQLAAAPHVGAPRRPARRGRRRCPSSRHSVDALGHPGEEGVGRLVDHAAGERRWSAPCRRAGRGSTTVTVGARRSAASRAATRPVMPPPTTTIAVMARRRATRSASAPSTAGSSLSDAGAGEGQPDLGRHAARLDVEVVEHLEVVGHEPLRAHEHAVGPPGGRRGRGSRRGCRGRATARACARRSASASAQPAHRSSPTALGDGRGRLAQLVGVRVVDQHPLGQASGR